MYLEDWIDVIHELLTNPRGLCKVIVFVLVCAVSYFVASLLFPNASDFRVWGGTVTFVSVIWLIIHLFKKQRIL